VKRWWPALVLLPLIACSGNSPSTPSPQAAPSPVPAPQPSPQPASQGITIQGTITDTVSRAVIGTFSQQVSSLPASVTVSAPGHVTRQTRVGSSSPAVDLIPTAPPFSSIFYGQLARNMLEASTPDVIHTLPAAPSLYLQTQGLSGGNIERLLAAAREIVPMMTGNRFTLTTIETGPDPRPERPGWVVVDVIHEAGTTCGRAYVGALSGHIWLNAGADCPINGDAVPPIVMRHEMGHALGFWHIDVPNSLMYFQTNKGAGLPTDLEKYHAAIAYQRAAGNRDPDIDASTAAPLSVRPPLIID
jgi:hypothetical protein